MKGGNAVTYTYTIILTYDESSINLQYVQKSHRNGFEELYFQINVYPP